uniref:Phosphatidylinositol specific phospholipase C X domain containing 1 n=1 Tax=Taeniopygia guttata TaxID=59729 RepID=H0ZK50_TAEGU
MMRQWHISLISVVLAPDSAQCCWGGVDSRSGATWLGSHDTMTYCLDKSSAVSGNESKLVKFLNKCLPCIVHPIIMKWSITQVLTVTEQLEAGVRYLDFRIAHKANDPSMNLYFVHMVYTTVTVQDILREILRWLETHPQEVVIIACRNFDGLTKRLHNHLVACIKEIFQCKLCPRNVSMKSFFSHFKRMTYHSEIFDCKFLDIFYFHHVFNLRKVLFAASEIGHYLIELRR